MRRVLGIGHQLRDQSRCCYQGSAVLMTANEAKDVSRFLTHWLDGRVRANREQSGMRPPAAQGHCRDVELDARIGNRVLQLVGQGSAALRRTAAFEQLSQQAATLLVI